MIYTFDDHFHRQQDTFYHNGPTHLAADDPQLWSDRNCKRAILACLVKGIYVSVHDLQANWRQPLAPPWWREFNYERIHIVTDEKSDQIVGAVYEWNSARASRPPCAPQVVVAFRGAMRSGNAFVSDMQTYGELLLYRLHLTHRFGKAFTVVKRLVKESGAENVCLTGHSLGAAISLLAGRILAEEGVEIDTYLFNPPYPSVPLELIEDANVQEALQVLRMISAAGLASLRNEQSRKETMNEFLGSKHWFPNLYINSSDPVCSSYLGYFKTRHAMAKTGHNGLAHFAAPHSARLELLLQASMITGSSNLRPFHLLPSAHLHFIDKRSSRGRMRHRKQEPEAWNLIRPLDWRWRQVHGLRQWWSDELHIHYHFATLDPLAYGWHSFS